MFNGSPRPPPQAPTNFVAGLLEYAAPPPGFEIPWAAHHYTEYLPHFPYMAYAHPPTVNAFKSLMVFKHMHGDCKGANIIKLTAPGEKGTRSPWGLQTPEEIPGEPTTVRAVDHYQPRRPGPPRLLRGVGRAERRSGRSPRRPLVQPQQAAGGPFLV